MPNWSSTSYAIEGPKETLQKIEQAINHPDVKEGSDESWEGNVLRALNITYIDRHDDRDKGKYMRGFIIDNPWWDKDALHFSAEEAWGVTDFDEVLMEAFPDVKVFWVTEEPNMEIYETNDKEGKYFKDRFYVDVCIDGNYEADYFQFASSVYKWLSDLTNGRVNSNETLEAFNDKYEGDDDNFIYVHEFRVSA